MILPSLERKNKENNNVIKNNKKIHNSKNNYINKSIVNTGRKLSPTQFITVLFFVFT